MLFQELSKIPFIRLLIPYILGILMQLNIPVGDNLIWYFIFSLTFILIILKSYKILNYNLRWVWGALLYITLLLFGVETTRLSTITKTEINHGYSDIQIIANMIESPVEKNNSYKSILKINSIFNDTIWINKNAKLLAYFEKDSSINNLKYGDKLIFSGKIQEITNPKNPCEFDYKNYLEKKGIYYQIYINANKWKKLSVGNENPIMQIANYSRKKLLEIYKTYSISGDEFSVLSALTLGYKAELDNDIVKAYAGSGAMHVLAVSGLHVGIIFMILDVLLKFLDKKRILIILKAVIIIISLWFFALISGLSPSVRRAALMFTLFVIGKTLNRQLNIYNTIAVSAFLLLLWNPYIITEVGFQLSYSAVIAIVFLQPKFSKLIYVKNKALNWIWGLLTVSVAAQIGTLPVSLLYFDQFPVYFLLTNIIVIPAATIILYTAATLFLISSIKILPAIPKIIALLLNYEVKTMNFLVYKIENLPLSTINDFGVNLLQVPLIYLILFSLSLLLIYKKMKYFQVFLFTVFFMFAMRIYVKYDKTKEAHFVVYNIKNSSAYNFVKSNKNILVCNNKIVNNEKTLDFAAKNFWTNNSFSSPKFILTDSISESNTEYINNFLYAKNGYINFCDKRILILNNNDLIKNTAKSKLSIDYLILANNINVRLEEINKMFKVKKVIIDSSNKKFTVARWLSEENFYDFEVVDISNEGAFHKIIKI